MINTDTMAIVGAIGIAGIIYIILNITIFMPLEMYFYNKQKKRESKVIKELLEKRWLDKNLRDTIKRIME